jgi:hypothetical protein
MRYDEVTIRARRGRVALGDWEILGGCAGAPKVDDDQQ